LPGPLMSLTLFCGFQDGLLEFDNFGVEPPGFLLRFRRFVLDPECGAPLIFLIKSVLKIAATRRQLACSLLFERQEGTILPGLCINLVSG